MQIAAELARGVEARRHVDAAQPLRQLLRQQRVLHALREAHFLLEAMLVGGDRLVEPGVLDRHRHHVGERRQHLDVLPRERVELGAGEIEHADAALLEHQRNDELGADRRRRTARSADPCVTSPTSTASQCSAA